MLVQEEGLSGSILNALGVCKEKGLLTWLAMLCCAGQEIDRPGNVVVCRYGASVAHENTERCYNNACVLVHVLTA
jgi:hypothetical protein